jgi:hypothetical protein
MQTPFQIRTDMHPLVGCVRVVITVGFALTGLCPFACEQNGAAYKSCNQPQQTSLYRTFSLSPQRTSSPSPGAAQCVRALAISLGSTWDYGRRVQGNPIRGQ